MPKRLAKAPAPAPEPEPKQRALSPLPLDTPDEAHESQDELPQECVVDDCVLRLVLPIQRLETLLKSGGTVQAQVPLLYDSQRELVCMFLDSGSVCVSAEGKVRKVFQGSNFSAHNPLVTLEGSELRFLGKVDSEQLCKLIVAQYGEPGSSIRLQAHLVLCGDGKVTMQVINPDTPSHRVHIALPLCEPDEHDMGVNVETLNLFKRFNQVAYSCAVAVGRQRLEQILRTGRLLGQTKGGVPEFRIRIQEGATRDVDDVKHNLVHFITSGDHKDETRTSLRKLPDGSWEEGDRQLMLTAVEYREVFNNAFPMENMARIIAAIPKSTLVRFHVIDHPQLKDLVMVQPELSGAETIIRWVVVPQVNPESI